MRHIKERFSYALNEARNENDVIYEFAGVGLEIAQECMEKSAKARSRGISSLCDVARVTFPVVEAGFAIASTPICAVVGVVLKPICFTLDFFDAPIKKKPDMQP